MSTTKTKEKYNAVKSDVSNLDTSVASTESIKVATTENFTAAKLATPDRYIYIGPAVPGGALPTNKIFNGTRKEIETLIADILVKYPNVNGLIVPVSRLAACNKKIQGTDNILILLPFSLISAVGVAEKRKSGIL